MDKKRHIGQANSDDQLGASSKEKRKKTEVKQVKSNDQPAISTEEQIMNFPPVVYLNVGGTKFPTTLTTLRKYPDSKLAAMFSNKESIVQDEDGNYFIDRNGDHFDHILNFLRDDEYIPPRKCLLNVLKEANHYKIAKLVETLENMPYVQALRESFKSNQMAAKTYHTTICEILKVAMSNVENHETKSGISKSSVLLISYKEAEPLRGDADLVNGLRQFTNKSIPKQYEQYKNRSVLIKREPRKNLTEICKTIVNVLAFEGFHVTFADHHEHTQGEPINFINACKETMVLSLEWNLQILKYSQIKE